MRDLTQIEALPGSKWGLIRHRGPDAVSFFGSEGGAKAGAFVLFRMAKDALRIIASNAEGWDHVSVSTATRTPTWAEMGTVKRLFFHEDEVAMQLHVAVSDHINNHPYVLHLWRPHAGTIPLPPKEFV